MPSPSMFNDPMDCRLPFDTTATLEEHVEHFVIYKKKSQPDRPEEEIRAELLTLFKNSSPEAIKAAGDGVVSDFASSAGVLSLSERNDSPLMWSHYASGQTGICLEFTPNENSIFKFVDKVAYQPTWPKYNMITGTAEQLVELLLIKGPDWSYEKEWRIIVQEAKGQFLDDPDLITGVIFGSETPVDEQQKMIKWINQGAIHPKLYKANKKEGQFGLEVTPYVPA